MIPFNVPYVPEASKKYVLEALESKHQQGDGPFTAKASKMVSNLVGGGHVLLTPSCTHALEMASMLANIGPGDEVILPSYTFTSAATAITKFGATPVFVDIEMETKGIDVNQVREAISPRTKAISWVNYAGVPPDIKGLQSLAREFDLLLIEDNAHGLGSNYEGKPLGSFGDFATQSFHATKNIQCGEGGALIVNNSKYVERSEIIREKGTNRSEFIRGEAKKYQWVDQGSSYLLSESLAAILLGQLENFTSIQTARKRILGAYREGIKFYSQYSYPEIDEEVAHMFYMQFSGGNDLEKFKQEMLAAEISVATHYQPLHKSKFGSRFLNKITKISNSETLSSTLLRLPLWVQLSEADIEKIVFNANEIVSTMKLGR